MAAEFSSQMPLTKQQNLYVTIWGETATVITLDRPVVFLPHPWGSSVGQRGEHDPRFRLISIRTMALLSTKPVTWLTDLLRLGFPLCEMRRTVSISQIVEGIEQESAQESSSRCLALFFTLPSPDKWTFGVRARCVGICHYNPRGSCHIHLHLPEGVSNAVLWGKKEMS